MPILSTAIRHFDQDIERARDLRQHARMVAVARLSNDIERAAWMMAVGACDAFFCDAYADLISRALRAKDLQPSVAIPDRLANLKIPAIAGIRQAAGGWRWRMAARELIEDQTVLSVERIKELFNQFCCEAGKLLTAKSIEQWILHKDSGQRLFGISSSKYRALKSAEQRKARDVAVQKATDRFEAIFQRRHDCIHNCDRPKVALQKITDAAVERAIKDVDFLAHRSLETLRAEFPRYLNQLGFSPQVRNQVCM